MLPVTPCSISQPFADPGDYASDPDRHGPPGHHTGIDYGSAWPIPIDGRLVRTVFDGVVVINDYNDTMGNWVGIYSPESDETYTYWHLSERDPGLHLGKRVKQGDVLGRVGSTGNSTAPHLHLQANPATGSP